MGTLPASQPASSRIQLAGLGFLVGAVAFAAPSLAASIAQPAVTARLCALPAQGHFPSGNCLLITALLGVLWMGPAAILAVSPVLQSALHSMLQVRILSDIMVAVFAALLFARAGIRKGALLFSLSSIALIGVLTLLFSMFAVMW